MAARIGLLVRERGLTGVVITGPRRLENFTIDDADDPAGALAATLGVRRLPRQVRVGLDRRMAIVRTIDLPRTGGRDLGAMIGFDLDRHVPFPVEGAHFDWAVLPGGSGDAYRVLLVVAERRSGERPLGVLAGAGCRPATMVVACHELPALLASDLPSRRTVWVHSHSSGRDLVLLEGRCLLGSRRIPETDARGLAQEIRRSWPLLRWHGCESVWLSGRDAGVVESELVAGLGLPVTAPPYAEARAPLIAALDPADPGDGLLALAVAVGSRAPALDLLPRPARPWIPSREQLVAAALLGVIALLGLALALAHVSRIERHVERLVSEIHRLDPEAKAVDRLAGEMTRKHAVLSALQAAREARVPALPVLRELTGLVPAEAWLQALTMDRQGVELVGQADAASGLIRPLEASTWLERVEFTAPVTRIQGKEQFRIRAAWEAAPAAPKR